MLAPMPLYAVSADQIALAAGTTKTICEIRTPASTPISPISWSITFDGTNALAVPVRVEVGRCNVTTGATSTTFSPYLVNYGGNAQASGCTTYINCNAEGSSPVMTGDVFRVPPTSGIQWMDSLSQGWLVPASSFFRIRCTAAAAVNVTFTLRWAE